MARMLQAGGGLAGCMGIGLILPVLVARMETSALTGIGIGLLTVGVCLIVGGLAAFLIGIRQRSGPGMPSGVRMAILATTLFSAFFALELSDRFVRQGGQLIYWSTFLLPGTLLLFGGLLTARPWAWWVVRAVSALGIVWFLGFVVMIPFAHLQADGVPVPWHGRVYMACVSLAFAGILCGAFGTLGSPASRDYFGLLRSREHDAA